MAGSHALGTLCKHQDGFKIAEVDLELRGAGDYFGTRQSGTPGSRMGTWTAARRPPHPLPPRVRQ